MAKESSGSKNKFDEFVPQEAREHVEAARQAYRKSYEALLPPEFLAQRRKARREMLRAARSFIDAALDRLESED